MEDDKLKEYLRNEWRRCNHKKYQHLFEVWYTNLTWTQLIYYREYMNGKKTFMHI